MDEEKKHEWLRNGLGNRKHTCGVNFQTYAMGSVLSSTGVNMQQQLMQKTACKDFEWPQEKGESGAVPYFLLVQPHWSLQDASRPAAGPYLVLISWWKALCHIEQHHLALTEMLLLFLNCNLGKQALPRMPPLAWKAEWVEEKRKKCSRAACKEWRGGGIRAGGMLIEKHVFYGCLLGPRASVQAREKKMHEANKGANALQQRTGLVTISCPPVADLGAQAPWMTGSGFQLASIPLPPSSGNDIGAKNTLVQHLVQ